MENDKRKQDDPAQSKRFIDAAREAGADETEEGAERAFKKVVAPSKVRKGRS
jgi:hypothetical protein